MKWIVRKEVVHSILVEADDEDAALDAAALRDVGEWDQSTKHEEAEREVTP